jgi:hypothetical protein
MHANAIDDPSPAAIVISILRRLVPRPGPESILAEDVRAALAGADLLAQHEAQLSQGRVDLRVGAVAVELKVQGTVDKVLAQLRRYAADPEIAEVVLVTTSAKLRAMPAEIGGKPLHVVYLPRL